MAYNVNQLFIAVNFVQLATHSRLLVALTLQNAEIRKKNYSCQYCYSLKKQNVSAT